ncbi:MAG: adenylate kinase [Ignavibacteria bacterium]|jgi:adenylate kinase|nr:adenylate kinase [Ignavibacteria bacterium]
MKLIIFGPPGAGKGTQSEIISKEYKLTQISSGDILRAKKNSDTQIAKLIKFYIDSGSFVPDDLIISIMSDEMKQCDDGYILDGFPRNTYQAKVLDEMLEVKGEKIDSVLCLRVPDEIIVARLSARRTCTVCSRVYHLEYNPPKKENKCDYDGAELYQRADDKEETILERIKIYHTETQPLIDYYQENNLNYCVDGSGDINEIFTIIKRHLNSLALE